MENEKLNKLLCIIKDKTFLSNHDIVFDEFDFIDSNEELLNILNINNINILKSLTKKVGINILPNSIIISYINISGNKCYLLCVINDDYKVYLYDIIPNQLTYMYYGNILKFDLSSIMLYEKIRREKKR